MRRLGSADRILLAAVAPLALGWIALAVVDGLRGQRGFFDFTFRSARGPADHPTALSGSWTGDASASPVRPGDELVAVDGRSLRGLRSIEVLARLFDSAREDGTARVAIERGGQRFEVELPRRPGDISFWSLLPFAMGCVVGGSIVLARRPDWPHARKAFLACALGAVAFVAPRGFGGAMVYAAAAAEVVGIPIALALTLRIADELSPRRVTPRSRRVLPWLFAAVYAWILALPSYSRSDLGLGAYLALRGTAVAIWNVALVSALVASYRRGDPLERRQMRWVALGLVTGCAPLAIAFGLHAAGLGSAFAYRAAGFALTAIPLGLLVAVVWYDFLDIDRVISATASYTFVGVGAAAAALAGVPALGRSASAAFGVAPGVGEAVSALLFAALLVPAHRLLRPRIDRLLFAEHAALERGVGALLDDLAACEDVPALVATAGARIDALLQPESLVLYAREGDAFTPAFVRAQAAAPAFPAQSPLVGALDQRRAPLVAARWFEGRAGAHDAFDRAALETLGAALVLPVRRGDALVAFVCLGPKRSGDIYTATELALLVAVASRLSDRLLHIDGARMAGEARALQAALRRYVPEAVAARVAEGEEVAPGEREVTVLFVDIRGYVGLVDGLSPRDVFSTVSRYAQLVSGVLCEHGGVVVEFSGDGMMAVFGAPVSLPRKERRAVEAAREIGRALGDAHPSAPGPPLAVGIGIATGPAFVGHVEAADRRIWSVIGHTTNLAARLQALSRELDAAIVVDATTHRAADYVSADFERARDVEIRGRRERLDLYYLPRAERSA